MSSKIKQRFRRSEYSCLWREEAAGCLDNNTEGTQGALCSVGGDTAVVVPSPVDVVTGPSECDTRQQSLKRRLNVGSRRFHIHEKAPIRAFSNAFTFKTL